MALVLLAVGAGLGYWLVASWILDGQGSGGYGSGPPAAEDREDNGEGSTFPRAGARATDDPHSGVVLRPEATVSYRTTYLGCGDLVAEEVTADRTPLAGMALSDIRGLVADEGWEVIEATAERVVLQREVDDLCAYHARYRWLKVRDDRLAVFLGQEGPRAILQQTLPLSGHYLTAEDRRRLEEGIVLDGGDASVWRYLEGLRD